MYVKKESFLWRISKMSLTKKELTDKNLYELEISVDHETFEAAVSRVYKKQVGKFNVPGFRKGKAPRSIIEKMMAWSIFKVDALMTGRK